MKRLLCLIFSCFFLFAYAIYGYTDNDGAGIFSVEDVEFDEFGQVLLQYPQDSTEKCYTIPNGVTVIGYHAFYGSNLESVVMPDSIVTIEAYAFEGCCNLKEIKLSSALNKIEMGAFTGCLALEYITLPDSLVYIGEGTFSSSGLKTIDIPDSVTTIMGYAFEFCNSLESVTMTNSVTEMGELVFRDCPGLKTVTLSSSVSDLYSLSENSLTELESVSFYDVPEDREPVASTCINWGNLGAVTSLDIPETVCSIRGCFQYSDSLNQIRIPTGVSYIVEDAFDGCENIIIDADPYSYAEYYAIEHNLKLKNEPAVKITEVDGVKFDESMKILLEYPKEKENAEYIIPDGVEKIMARAFFGCEKLESVKIPDSVCEIEGGAFTSCISLKEISIPETVDTLEYGTFADCSSLHTVILPDVLTVIGRDAFRNCTALKNIAFPSDLKYIGKQAFFQCESLTSAVLPESVEYLGDYAFGSCMNLTSVSVPGSVESISWTVFSNCNSLSSICIHDGIKAASIDVSNILGKVILPDSVENLGRCTFSYTQDSFSIPKSVKRIENSGFDFLNDITIHASVSYIKRNVFSENEELCIHADPDSYAEYYARQKGYSVVLNESPFTDIGSLSVFEIFDIYENRNNFLPPEDKSIQDNYTIKYIRSPEGHSVNTYIDSGLTSQRPFYAAEGEPVLVLAEKKINGNSMASFCVFECNGRKCGWINSQYLYESLFKEDMYENALKFKNLGYYKQASKMFELIYEYRDSREQLALCQQTQN